MLKLMLIGALALAVPAIAFAGDRTATLRVEGWTCGGCTAATRAALEKVPGVKDVKTDLESGTATVTFDDSKASVADLQKAVTATGYKVIE
jgi:copper chaperone CopZ